jgi:hypothetical protein
VLRARALGLLANPALACVLLATHHTGTDHTTDQTGTDQTGWEPSTAHSAAALGRTLLTADAATRGTVLDRLRPRTVLYLHLNPTDPTVARAEGLGPTSLAQLRDWLGIDEHADRITLRPVLGFPGQRAVDAYETPPDLAEALRIRHPHEIFPWGTRRSRTSDLDHTTPYQTGHPEQTGPHNLGPLARGHHNLKTHGTFTCHQPLPGLYLWRTPTGHWYRVDHHGTHALGRDIPEIIRQRRHARSPVEYAFHDLLTAA